MISTVQISKLIYGDLDSDKKWLLKRLIAQSFFSGLANAFFFVAAYSSMLGALKIAEVPYAYLSSGLGGILLIKLFQRIQKDYGAIKSHFIITVLFALWLFFLLIINRNIPEEGLLRKIIGIASFTLVIPFSAVFALNIATNCFQVLGVVQGKKWVAKLGIGETLAAMLAFLITPTIVDLFGNSTALFAVGSLAMLPLLGLSVVEYIKTTGSRSTYSLQDKVELKSLWNIPFFKVVIITTGISVLMIYWVDFTYIVAVRKIAFFNNTTTSDVVSSFFALVKSGELLGSILSAEIIRKLTTRKSLIVFSWVLLSVALLVMVLHFGLQLPMVSLIYFILSLKWFERVFRRTIEAPASRIMMQVAKPAEKAGLQTAIEGIVSQIATAIAAFLLLIAAQLHPDAESTEFLVLVVFMILMVSLFWVTRTNRVSKRYTVRLSTYLKSVAEDRLSVKSNSTEIEVSDDKSDNTGIETKEAIKKFYHSDILIQAKTVQNLPAQISKIEELLDLARAAALPFKAEILSRYYNENLVLQGEIETKFNIMLMDIGEALVWIDLSIEDLRGEDLREYYLYLSLKQARDMYIKQVFTLLSWKYSREEMEVIEGFMTGDKSSADDAQFAMELLDTVLPELLKPYLLPIFESNTLESKIKRWRQYIPAHQFNSDDRLKDIVMRDYAQVPLSAKYWALRILNKNPNHQAFIRAFQTTSKKALFFATEPKISIAGNFLEQFERSLDYKNSKEVFIKTELLVNWLNQKEKFIHLDKENKDFKAYCELNFKLLSDSLNN